MKTTEEPVLVARGLSKTYRPRGGRGREVVALDGVDLDLRRGSILAVVGESGSGKSTLARCLALLEEPTSGEITLSGERITAADSRRRAAIRTRVQLVFQHPVTAVNPRFSALRTVTEPLRIQARGDREWRRQRALEAMREVDFPGELHERSPQQLSGGQLQRLAVARALVLEPRILILDESLAALDLSLQAHIANLLLELRRRGLALLLISHDLRLAAHLADEFVVLDHGRIVERGIPEELFTTGGDAA